ncbi:winged helix-turn-helix domain-containing protein [Klebsiella aerogenes]|uniref:winged helix-turn-helix domain-containing protein n=1 Tax=Klebsiella aerogenes TaxID=548 RepID=UPI00254ABAE0|nr:winged helix-turn-helix domain-containing protein [Klebsiella aerogenes]MDK6932409.1 winged helix-turn-helix domain-containing protein [Klebsiella aerogenes]
MSLHDARTERSAVCFTIEETLRFCPENNTLYNISNQEIVNILSTASNCFRLLIEEQGSILSKEQLIEQVWGKRGIVISHNTFYQTMLNLRRGLENAGMQNDIISTHYGKGVSISKEIKIVRSSYEIVEVLQGGREEEKNTLTAVAITDVINEPEGRPSSHPEFLNRLKTKCFFLGFSVFLITLIVYAAINHFFMNDNFFSSYRKANVQIDDCKIYINPDHLGDFSLENTLKKWRVYCKNNERVFISLVEPVRRLSVIHCNNHLTEEEECVSDFYLD